MTLEFDAYVTAALFDAGGKALFALGDGTVRDAAGGTVEAHDGAILCAVAHPQGGVLTGADDGRLVWSRDGKAQELASLPGKWIEAVAAGPESGLIGFAAGREAHVRDLRDAAFARTFAHEKSVADLAFDPKGRRLACATYGGVHLWYARVADQKPQILKWAGSHVIVAWSPDGKFILSAMQENQLHGWRLADAKDMRMGGYPSKVKSLAFLSKGALLATSGANGVVLWPFVGNNGPMGKEAAEIGFDQAATVARVAATPDAGVLAAGLDDGRVWACEVKSGRLHPVKSEKGAAITALAVTPKGDRLAWGDEDGAAGVADLPRLGA